VAVLGLDVLAVVVMPLPGVGDGLTIGMKHVWVVFTGVTDFACGMGEGCVEVALGELFIWVTTGYFMGE
jgi:hypothetical protein